MQPPCQTLKALLGPEDRREPKYDHKTCQSGRLESSRGAPYDEPMAGIAAGRPPLQIGSFQPPTRVFLAPMAGFTDLPFRRLVRECGGCGLATTDLLNCRSILAGHPTALRLAETNDVDSPVGMQLYGNDTDPLPEAADWAVNRGIDVLDINMGCPIDKVCKKNGGSLLLCDPERTVRLVERILAAVRGRVPVTAKLRLGWDDDQLTGPRLAQMLESVGIAAIAIHGRTTEMKFRGHVRLEGIGRVVEAVRNIPVLGNGDIESPQDAEHMMRTTGCDGVMLARAATRQPWLLSRIHQLLEHGKDPGELDHHGMLMVVRRHVELCREHCEERRSLHVLRSRISRYARSLGHVKPLKEAFRLAEHTDEMLVAINEWLERSAPRRGDPQSQSLACPSQP